MDCPEINFHVKCKQYFTALSGLNKPEKTKGSSHACIQLHRSLKYSRVSVTGLLTETVGIHSGTWWEV